MQSARLLLVALAALAGCSTSAGSTASPGPDQPPRAACDPSLGARACEQVDGSCNVPLVCDPMQRQCLYEVGCPIPATPDDAGPCPCIPGTTGGIGCQVGRNEAGACLNCCKGDVCGYPADPDGTCLGPNGPGGLDSGAEAAALDAAHDAVSE